MTARTADSIFDALVARIVAGRMQPGEPLAEVALAEQFGVSRTPVREALHRLEQADLAERGARRAFVVRRMKPGDLADLFEALGEVEGVMAALAAQRMTEIDRQHMGALLAEGRACGDDAERYAAVNARFHALLKAGARNAALAAVFDELNLRTQAWRAANFHAVTARLDSSRAEHEAIAQAILARDAEAARNQMRRHVAASHSVLAEILAQRAP